MSLLTAGALMSSDLAGAGPPSSQRLAGGRQAAATSQSAGTAKKKPNERFICQRRRARAGAVASRRPRETVLCKPGPAGPPGPPGPAGAPGPAGSAQRIIIPRTVIPFTTNFMSDGGNVQNLVKVGPIHIDGLCRRTFTPGTGGGANKNGPTHPDPRLPTRGGESEAQIMVWTETGSLTFQGQVGPRKNVPPGPPDYTLENNAQQKQSPGGSSTKVKPDQPAPDPVAGEGDHLFLAASNENADETRATDPAADNPANPNVRKLTEYPAFQFAGGLIGTSTGHAVLADMVGGMDVLGAYGECVFGGVVRTLS
ncbi:MAG TPA: hypothetical protein VGY97_04815 [Solirubrobacteraceae bacterium]|nr:hypothetical protein [Solirubrobacteraceae bacterium]